MDSPPRLSLRAITKRFPSTLANDAVDLDLAAGEIHALLGENGAGKSTLVKIVAGVLQPDAGTVAWEGQPVVLSGPAQARALGIGVVFQHFALFESLTVAENLALGSGGAVPGLAQRIRTVADKYGLALDPERPVWSLSVGERQRVEIVRCLLRAPRLLIMDEPTSVLTPQEVGTLFDALRRLADEGCSILYISHKLDEIRVLCHRATVLRGGRVVATLDPTRETPHSLAELMIGRDLVLPERRPGHAPGAPRLQVQGLSVPAEDIGSIALQDISLAVRAGEILGIAGVAGNGQAELMAALSGERPAARADAIRLDGTAVGRAGPAERRRRGLAVVPEERLGRGAVPELSLAENALLSSYPRAALLQGGLIRLDRIRALAARIIQGFQVVAPGPAAEARSLSGGNLQKFIVGREILQEPTVLVAAQPTWGVDAGAAAAIHRALLDLAERGAAVLVLSQDLEELFRIADRIAVIFHGRLSPARRTHDTTVEQIGLLMGGRFDLVTTAEVEHAA